ncbi:cell wall metabolism sensor histidine kinase WalK [Eggerthella sp. YY7918]|uniref:sensor histidine kinase n=1 Tax=Eggerthella sp. (strain YY7918) TaxID=502558 RepID=UPI00021711FF|nr:sensor histidine kinase [Eggerthella sp. YY7918]BAK45236.1 hypothetical protein EGYY_21460 [Eggerthella sp. YY7918]
MNEKRERRVLWIVLPLILLVCLSLWYARTFYRYDITTVVEVESQAGVWDLTNVDFTNTIVKLTGDTTYLPNAILTPDEFAAHQAQATLGEPGEEGAPCATSFMRVLLPDKRTYMLHVSSIDFAHRLYLNGELRLQAGTPAATAEEFQPGYLRTTIEVTPEVTPAGGQLDIVQQGANFVHREGGNHAGHFIGLPNVVRPFNDLKSDMELLIAGLFLALFLVFTTLYVVFRSYKSNLLFALLCLTWFVRTGVTGAKVFYTIIPALPWQLAFRAEYLTLPVACILLLLLVREQFPGIVQKAATVIIAAVSGGFATFCLVADTVAMSWAVVGYTLFYNVVIVYLIVRFALKLPGMLRAHTLQTEHLVALGGFAVFLLGAVHDGFYYLNIYLAGISFSLLEISMLIFAFTQMTANFYGTLRQVLVARENEQRLAAEKDVLAEMGRLKSRLYADVSHEMKTPLTVIAANAQFAAQNITAGAVDRETVVDLHAISAEAKRLGQMVTSLVQLNRTQDAAQGTSALPLDALVRDTARMYQSIFAHKHNRLSVEVDPALPLVEGDVDQLTQVLINLLANANKHTAHGQVTLQARCDAGGVRVSVTDTGEGIAPELLPHVFERYQRGDEDGTGLGLPICKTIVEEHGGQMGVESEPGAGTRVWFTLPGKDVKNDG